MIRFEKVCKRLIGRSVLEDVSFDVQTAEIFVIVGPSRAGKSVTLKHMICLYRPDEGSVFVGDELVNNIVGSELEKVRGRFGVLFQGSALLEWLNIGDNVALPLREKTTLPEEEILDTVKEKLSLVGLENEMLKRPSELSGGMRKRAGLARALVENPEIVLYDEPTAGLDPVSSRAIDRLIDRMRVELGVTSIVVTHDLHTALTIGSRIAMIYQGRIVEIATPEDFIRSKHPEVIKFLESQFITKSGPWEKRT